MSLRGAMLTGQRRPDAHGKHGAHCTLPFRAEKDGSCAEQPEAAGGRCVRSPKETSSVCPTVQPGALRREEQTPDLILQARCAVPAISHP